MLLKYCHVLCLLFSFWTKYGYACQLRISEVFSPNTFSTSLSTETFIEIQNVGSSTCAPETLVLSRFDGANRTLGMRYIYDKPNLNIPSGAFRVITQKNDLNVGQCPDVPFLTDPRFDLSFKKNTKQTLCLSNQTEIYNCVTWDRNTLSQDQSINFSDGIGEAQQIRHASCRFFKRTFATPGEPPDICDENSDWLKDHFHNCADKVVSEALFTPYIPEVVAGDLTLNAPLQALNGVYSASISVNQSLKTHPIHIDLTAVDPSGETNILRSNVSFSALGHLNINTSGLAPGKNTIALRVYHLGKTVFSLPLGTINAKKKPKNFFTHRAHAKQHSYEITLYLDSEASGNLHLFGEQNGGTHPFGIVSLPRNKSDPIYISFSSRERIEKLWAEFQFPGGQLKMPIEENP